MKWIMNRNEISICDFYIALQNLCSAVIINGHNQNEAVEKTIISLVILSNDEMSQQYY